MPGKGVGESVGRGIWMRESGKIKERGKKDSRNRVGDYLGFLGGRG